MSAPTLLNIHITLDEKEQITLTFSPEKYNWENLVDAIISNSSTCIDLPILLYYRNGLTIGSVENGEQLSKLSKVTEFYTQSELVKETAFVRLGKLVATHKGEIASNPYISRCIGIMASAIALDTNNKAFENEFTALEKLILSGQDDTPVMTTRPHAEVGRFGRGRHGGRHGRYHGDFGGKCSEPFRRGDNSEEVDVLRAQLSNTHIDKREFKRHHGGLHH
ncbi:hypothetical protein INT47_007857 [Mucor saturninus]|uniref:Uncharacterized protein n=1 Tax=Mucor saturninus TaxID=64648 RepID=A0A8H7RDP4_9FUNG|nr:hypothetical protein INT47_007857 [Mucor saturninus]